MRGISATLLAAVCVGLLEGTLVRPLAAQGQPNMSATGLTMTMPNPDTTAFNAGKSAASATPAVMTANCGNSSGSCRLQINATGTGLNLEWSLVGVTGTGCTGATSTTFVALGTGMTVTGVGIANGKTCVATFAFHVTGLSWTVQTTTGGVTANPTVQKAVFTLTKP